MDLSNAEVAVTTQHILDGKEYKDYWVQMSDYSDMGGGGIPLCLLRPLSRRRGSGVQIPTMGEHTRQADKPRVDMSQLLRDTRCP